MMRLFFAFILLASLSATGQILPDSILIAQNTYVISYNDGDAMYDKDIYPVVRKGKNYQLKGRRVSKSRVLALVAAIDDPGNKRNILETFQIDTSLVKNNPNALLQMYTGKAIEWNEQQKAYMLGQLSDPANFEQELKYQFTQGCCYGLHRSYRDEYVIEVFEKGKVVRRLTSRKHLYGYKMPWINEEKDSVYNYDIELALDKILRRKSRTQQPATGNKLLGDLVNSIVRGDLRKLYRLSAGTYQKEIDELNTDFKVVSHEEVYGQGRYIWSNGKTFKIVLKNDRMFDNVYMVFMASNLGKTLYPRDSIKKDYGNYIDRVQSIKFLSGYLKANDKARLDIYYFNNRGINDYNIANVNKSPTEWKMHDEYVALLKRVEKHTNDTAQNRKIIELSEKTNCGCNYRFDRSYIEKAIFFEVLDANGNTSIWYLLPDNKVLLYLMDNDTALHFRRSDFAKDESAGLVYPCALFDTDGNRIPR